MYLRNRRAGAIIQCALVLCALTFGACTTASDDETSGTTSALLRAYAPSMHYVQLTFDGPIPEAALDRSRYSIEDRLGNPLPVLDALRQNEHQVVLATEAQGQTRYSVSFDPGDVGTAGSFHDDGEVSGSTARLRTIADFEGSTLGEAYVESATAISNTEVVVVFSGKLGSGANVATAYRIDSPNLEVQAVQQNADVTAVLLTTSPQEALEYTLRVAPLEIQGTNKTLLDPTRTTVTFAGVPAVDATAPRLLRAEATTSQRVVLTFSEALSSDAASPTHFTVSPNLVITNVELALWETQVVLHTAPMLEGVEYAVTAGGGVRDRARIALDPGASTATFSAPALSDSQERPRVVGAVSTSNTTVLVRFSRPMNDEAIVASNYSIVQENLQAEAGALLVTGARFLSANAYSVELTTRSQNELTYRVRVSNVADQVGNPLAASVTSQGVLVDPTSATFAGSPPGSGELVDSDGDGLSDNVEQAGWTVTVVLTDGTVVTREVTSSPDQEDTDNDGLLDGTEILQGSDPRSTDTDRDGLSDNEEYNVVLSNPNVQDTDGDSIDDFLEVEFFKTNALVADSDGDGFTDDEELFERNRDPRVADLPSHEVTIGAVNLRIDERYTYTDENGDTRTETSNTSTSLNTTETSRHMSSGGFRVWAHAGVGAGPDEKVPVVPEVEVGAEGSAQFENESTTEAVRAYERSVEKGYELSQGHAVTREVVGASVGVDVMLKNTSDVAFSLTNLEVTLQAQASDDPTKLVPIATLVPERTLLTGNDVVLTVGPGQSRGPIHMVNREVIPAVVEDLLRAPRGVVFKISNYDMVSEDERNFAYGLQTVRERTVTLIVDSGEGTVQNYHAIAAGVLNRPRDEMRCAPVGARANALCSTDADCGASAPCEGGSVVGGLSGYDGTGRTNGIPVDFLLQDVLQMQRTRPPGLVAGPNGIANTSAQGDDTQIIPVGASGLAADALVIGPGRNLVLDTVPQGDDVNPAPFDGIKAGPNKRVDSIASGDDVQLVPAGTFGVVEDTVVITAGQNGVLDTLVRDDDVADTVTGYEVSPTCDSQTPYAILAGRDLRADTTVAPGRCSVVPADKLVVVGDLCHTDEDCGNDTSTGDVGVCHTDVQATSPGTAVTSRDAVVVSAPADGFMTSVPSSRDVYVGPGVPCTSDLDCRVPGLGAGTCQGPQKVVRVGARRDGEFRRFWALMLPDDVQYQTDFGLMRVRAGDVIGLQFIQDLDRDGLSSEVEFLAGSSDFSPDTDADGLGDYAEVRVGWVVGAVGQPLRRVFSDPRVADSDRDGLTDLEESDFRPLQCACDATGPENLVVGGNGEPCSSDSQCGGGVCRSTVGCSPSDMLSGQECPVCSDEPTLNRTDPRRADTDGDRVRDREEVFGYLTGAGIVDLADEAVVILAGPDMVADTLACPDNYCEEDSQQHCSSNADCRSHKCIRPVLCDDVQVVAPGTSVPSARTVVVAPGPIGYQRGSLATREDMNDVLEYASMGAMPGIGESRAVGDDSPIVGQGEFASATSSTGAFECADGSRFITDNNTEGLASLPLRFPMCAVVKPGPNGTLESLPGGEDVLIPGGSGQRLEWTDPLSPDSDMDLVQDGYERVLGSSPNDPSDTGQSGDRDRDGLSDRAETFGWQVSHTELLVTPTSRDWVVRGPRTVHSNMFVVDTDADGLPDYAERHMPCFGSFQSGAECPTDPTNPDTDGDGLSDFDEPSAEQLQVLAAYSRYFAGYAIVVGDSKAYGTDPTSQDSDGDAVSDSEELFGSYRVSLYDGTTRTVRSDPRIDDTDGDGLRDDFERVLGTDATDPDTDDDGRVDNLDRGDGATNLAMPNGFNPLIPDLRARVRFHRIDVNSLVQPGEHAKVAFFFLARASENNILPANPSLVANANDVDIPPGIDANVMTRTRLPATSGSCWAIDSNQPQGSWQFRTGNDNTRPFKEVSAFLKKGQFVTLEGLIFENNGGDPSTDCGNAPTYYPAYYNGEDCRFRFERTLTYEELSESTRGDVQHFNAMEGAVGFSTNHDGKLHCDFDVPTSLVVD